MILIQSLTALAVKHHGPQEPQGPQKPQKPSGHKKVEFILYMTFLFCTPTMTGLKFASWESFVKTTAI